ncbi:MAG TPA: hypothetical protein VMT62_03710 [Syntrophorhabdaceae bacterium]|nr:hypothetical protein [Syntrophorhabdaceae bacterium]
MKAKLLKKGLLAAALLCAFLAGRQSMGDSDMFQKGYDTAMDHVRSTINTRMPELRPFYIHDLGIRFTPHGGNIVSVRFYGSVHPSDDLADRKLAEASCK